jgi:hypothetical protein
MLRQSARCRMLLGAAALMVTSIFLPHLHAEAHAEGTTRSISVYAGDVAFVWWWTVIAAGAICGVGAFERRLPNFVISTVSGFVGLTSFLFALVLGLVLRAASRLAGVAVGDDIASVNIGLGLWAVGLAGLLSLAVAMMTVKMSIQTLRAKRSFAHRNAARTERGESSSTLASSTSPVPLLLSLARLDGRDRQLPGQALPEEDSHGVVEHVSGRGLTSTRRYGDAPPARPGVRAPSGDPPPPPRKRTFQS